jgi:uncharacterized protein (DUF983 family)
VSGFRLRSAYPVSPKCPRCGSADFRRVEAETSLAFTDDRVCKQCGTRYTPPIPAWARVVFAVVGFGALAVMGVMAFWAQGGAGSSNAAIHLVGGGLVGLGCL